MWMFDSLKQTFLLLIILLHRIISHGFNLTKTRGTNSSVQDPFGSIRCYCHTTVLWCIHSPVMCLLKWRRVIEWDNLKTQGLGLVLATIFSEERHFSHCLLSLFLRAYTQTPTCTQKYVNPFWKQGTYSDTHTAAPLQPTPQAIDNKCWTVHSAQKEINMFYTNWITVSQSPPPCSLLVGHACWSKANQIWV